jgi:hypothetical protein
MSGERRYRLEPKSGIILLLLLVALGIAVTFLFHHYDVQLLVP